MSDAQFICHDAHQWALVGALTFGSVTYLEKDIETLFTDNQALRLDLAGVTRSDSAGLAFLIGLLRRAQLRDTKVTFLNLPEQLRAIARVSGIETLLPVA